MSATSADDPLAAIAVVIPVAPGDGAWRALLPDLAALPRDAAVVLAGAAPLDADDAATLAVAMGAREWRWLVAPRGRARQLNAGARAATRPLLWFLHADTRLAPGALDALRGALRVRPRALHYFDLAFLPDGPRRMRLNAIGVRVRSRWLGMPFGDQGFCVHRDVFTQLGGFDERAPYGEDHLFVWRARQAGVRLHATGGRLLTSARRYREQGWARTTLRHLRLTARQALPEWLALLRARRDRARATLRPRDS
ncbi:MAG: TIGR04283 family arsenosugar biosynthesis glycosyltransferase [Gemmatirosa sp.]